MSKKRRKKQEVQNQLNGNENQGKQPTVDVSKHIFQRDKINKPLNIRHRTDFTDNQKKFTSLALDKNTKLMFVSGPAGTSKTFMALYTALQLLNDHKISDIMYLRSVVESSSHSIGFLKGDLDEKMSVYLHPLMDKLEELLPQGDINSLMKEKRVTGEPLNFIRGSHWAVKAVLFDEAQNATYPELFTLITRMGEYSKLFILGDTDQSDIKNSGFEKMITLLDDQESRDQGIHVFRFTVDDVVRSELVKFLLKKLKTKV